MKVSEIFVNKEIDIYYWKTKSKIWGDPLHKICPYNAMFPVSIADYFIKNFTNENDIILDPFSGRGTTLLQGRILNRKTYSSDLNPMSYVLSKSKEKTLDVDKIIIRINELEKEFKRKRNYQKILNKVKNVETMKNYYSEKNLIQISFVREKIGKNWSKNDNIDNFILAITLGLMHGPSKKDGTSSYFSVSMSNGISMSPNYVRKFVENHNLKYIESNIFEQIKNKILKVYYKKTDELSNTKQIGEFRISNALEISKTWKDIKPKLIFTSPPYLNIINYTKQNWIKMWMLGFETDVQNKKIGLDDKHKEKTYLDNFLIPFMKQCKDLMSNESNLIMIIGDVIKKDSIYSIFDKKEYIQNRTNLKLVEVYIDKINQNNKSTNSMGIKAGKATQIDRVYIFKK